MQRAHASGYSLLGEAPAGLSSGAVSAVSQWLMKLLREWWAVSTSSSFRSSWLSRRQSTRLFPLIAFLSLADDFRRMESMDRADGLKIVCIDLIFIVSTFAVCCYPLDSWRLDWYIFATVTLYGTSWIASTHSHELDEGFLFIVVCWVVLLAAMGVHSCAGLLFGCISAGQRLIRGKACDAAAMVALTGLISFFAAFGEHCNGRICKQVEDLQAATHHLLDTTSDGFCSVDVRTGEIVSSSARLSKTFGAVGGTGAFVAEWAAGDSEREQLAAMLQSARSGSELNPCLVTCRRPLPPCGTASNSAVFDGKVIPFKIADELLHLCIQVVGEAREVDEALAAEVMVDVDEGVSVVGELVGEMRESDDEHKLDSHAPAHSSAQSDITSLAYSVSAASGSQGQPAHLSRLKRCCEQGTQTEASGTMPGGQGGTPQPERVSRGVETHLAGSPSGFELKRAARPPLPESAAPRQAREAAAGAPPAPGPRPRRPRGSSGRTGLLPALQVPRKQACARSILWCARRWNAPREAEACCPMHAQLILMRRLVRDLARERCDPAWQPMPGWQCQGCALLNAEGAPACDICGQSREPHPGGVPAPAALEPGALLSGTSGEAADAVADAAMAALATLHRAAQGAAAPPAGLGESRRHRRKMRLQGGSVAVKGFKETSQKTVNYLLMNALAKINPKGSACCSYHLALLVLLTEAKGLAALECDVEPYEPCLDWQCQACLAMNVDDPDDEGMQVCEVCCNQASTPAAALANTSSGHDAADERSAAAAALSGSDVPHTEEVGADLVDAELL